MDSVFSWEGGASRKNHVLSTRIALWKITKENSVLVFDFERTVFPYFSSVHRLEDSIQVFSLEEILFR